MKRIIAILVMFLFASNCILLNTINLNPGHEKGNLARDRIIDAAIAADLLSYTLLTRSPGLSVFSLIADDLAGIEPSAYYKSSDVDDCIAQIYGLPGIAICGGFAALICDLKKDNLVYDP